MKKAKRIALKTPTIEANWPIQKEKLMGVFLLGLSPVIDVHQDQHDTQKDECR
ncbi:hypothetical protein HYZ80_02870 [Candidatus Parcubacteria bacterium]|nr:hypothetical protein [Candidatus Parcubacteria bacterium]